MLELYYDAIGKLHFLKEKVEGYYTPDEYTNMINIKSLRKLRDRKLASTDFYMMTDYPIEEEKKSKVAIYRQALRDITKVEGCPWDGGKENTPWPVLEI